MKKDELFKYQPEAMQLLTRAYEKKKLVHAYLLDGEIGTGTVEAGIYMAKQLICKSDHAPCFTCSDCIRIDNHSHLSYMYIEPIGDLIKKEQIEHLIHEFSMSSLESDVQVYIIKDADKMNSAAANSLLKFLEEPNPNHYAFLTTTNYKKMLDTIVSRCQLIHFKPIPKAYLMNELKNCGVDKDISYIVSFLTTDLTVALKYIEQGKINNLLVLAKKIVDKEVKGKDGYVEYFRNKNLLLEEKEKNIHRFFLDILVLIYQEILQRCTNDGNGYFNDILKDIDFGKMDKENIIKKLDCINQFQERFNYFVNLDLQYTSLFSKL